MEKAANESPGKVTIAVIVEAQQDMPTFPVYLTRKEFPHMCHAECVHNKYDYNNTDIIWPIQDQNLGNLIDALITKHGMRQRKKQHPVRSRHISQSN
jgi:hypothetical protein